MSINPASANVPGSANVAPSAITTDYASPEAAGRANGLSRYVVLMGVARGYVRALPIAGGRVLVHLSDVAALADQLKKR
jgi:hypothetical protein